MQHNCELPGNAHIRKTHSGSRNRGKAEGLSQVFLRDINLFDPGVVWPAVVMKKGTNGGQQKSISGLQGR